ncbi:MAG: holo-ACP synthase [Acidimicrobiales bacterium]
MSEPPARGELVGVGLDSVDIDRFATILRRRPLMQDRLFSAGERAYAGAQRNPVPSLAARFAVKEATMKALGVGLGALDWTDVEVVRERSGRPSLAVRGRAAALASSQGVASWQVSITHTSRVASAVVMALR